MGSLKLYERQIFELKKAAKEIEELRARKQQLIQDYSRIKGEVISVGKDIVEKEKDLFERILNKVG